MRTNGFLVIVFLALALPAGAQKDVIKRAECPEGMGIYLTSKNKVMLGVPEKMLGRKLLIGGTVSAVSDPGAANVGQMASGPLMCIIPTVEDSLLVLRRPQVAGSSRSDDLRTAMDRNFSAPILKRLPFERRGGRILFDITSLVTKAAPKGADFKPGNEDGTCWYDGLKAFEDNASIKLFQTVEANGLCGKATVSMESTVSVLMLPATPMRPRLQDSRIGTFYTGGLAGGNRFDLNPDRDGLQPYRLANRWRIEPSDMEAWQRGASVSVKQPIVWYIDDAFPQLWKQPVREGVLAWNAAFEAIGLKGALEVRDFPADDPSFDPDNLKYNCIRYIPNATSNAMGPSWTDPETGEIVSASVLLFNDVVRLLNNWRFVQTAQVDPRVRTRKMPDEVLQEALVYAVSHEVGHTLGLLHNMAGSAAIPVDSLRSPSFTAVYGTTASIMDYARFNYVAQPGDTDVRLVPPSLGVYDKYAIEWLYKPVPEALDLWDEASTAEILIDAHEGDPFYRFGAQQASMAVVQYDPTARTQDLGDDPLKAGDYGIANLRYILPHMCEWISDDPDYSHRRQLYSQLVIQFGRYLGNVESLIGGVVLYKTKTGEPCVPVPSQKQKDALRWVVSQVAASAWLDEPSVTDRLGLHASESAKAAVSVAQYLSGSAPVAVATAQSNGSTYTSEAYFEDLFDAVFHGGAYTEAEHVLQRALIPFLPRRSAPVKPQESKNTGICFGEDIPPTQPSVDISAQSDTAVYRHAFLQKVKKWTRTRRNNPEFAYIYSLID